MAPSTALNLLNLAIHQATPRLWSTPFPNQLGPHLLLLLSLPDTQKNKRMYAYEYHKWGVLTSHHTVVFLFVLIFFTSSLLSSFLFLFLSNKIDFWMCLYGFSCNVWCLYIIFWTFNEIKCIFNSIFKSEKERKIVTLWTRKHKSNCELYTLGARNTGVFNLNL